MKSGKRPQLNLTASQKANLAARLTLRPDRSDEGGLLPATKAALGLPQDTAARSAERVAALARALAHERLVVPIPVETDPHAEGHEHQGLGEDDHVPLATTPTEMGPIVVAFSSVEELDKWDAQARPMTMPSQKVALTAGLATSAGQVWVDPAGDGSTVLPRQVVHALAGGDQWLPPWEDASLRTLLTEVAKGSCPLVVSVSVKPAATPSKWEGGVDVMIYVDGAGKKDEEVRACLTRAVRDMASNPRLVASATEVNFVPRLVSLA